MTIFPSNPPDAILNEFGDHDIEVISKIWSLNSHNLFKLFYFIS